ncbi:MAG: type II toxin-antitoxin system VapC family toxin [Parabacteroides johnsonii]|nr:type II toxin-antitoxin system VapC family toxin [Parabacteroides johnsonii]
MVNKSYGQIKANLECKGLRIDDFDILIGATALQNKLVMVTANIGHLNRIPNLIIENWE